MKRTLAGIIALFLAGGVMYAQNGITVKNGQKIPYAIASTIDVVQTIQGQDMTVNSATETSSQLIVRKLRKDGVDWEYNVGKARMRTKSSMLPMPSDTVLKVPPYRFATDMSGRMVNAPGLDGTLLRALGTPGNPVKDMFSTFLLRVPAPGESWKEQTVDTVQPDGIDGAMLIARVITHTYDGIVDTLGVKTHRLRSVVDSMSVTGKGSVQGMALTMSGGGTSNTFSYYSATDGLLVSSRSNAKMNLQMALSGQVDLLVPVTQTTSMTIQRKGK